MFAKTPVDMFVFAIRKEYESKGNSSNDAYAYALGYLSSKLQSTIDSLPAKQRNAILKDLEATTQEKLISTINKQGAI